MSRRSALLAQAADKLVTSALSLGWRLKQRRRGTIRRWFGFGGDAADGGVRL